MLLLWSEKRAKTLTKYDDVEIVLTVGLKIILQN